MNKGELIDTIAEKADISRVQAQRVLGEVLDSITDELSKGESVILTGFGIFEVRQRSAREGINPQNPSQKIKIPARKVPVFRAGKKLKDSVSKK